MVQRHHTTDYYYEQKANFYGSDLQVVTIEFKDGRVEEFDIVKNKQSLVFRAGNILSINNHVGDITIIATANDIADYAIAQYANTNKKTKRRTKHGRNL